MKKKLDNKIRKYATAEKEAPVSAPKASFLGSGLSGILEQMNDSPGGSDRKDDGGKEGSNEDGKETKNIDTTVDHVEVADMDLDSDSENGDNPQDKIAPEATESNADRVTSTSEAGPSPATNAAAQASPSSTTSGTPSGPPVVSTDLDQRTTTQYGYTMTASSVENHGNASPASNNSAPSPEGSPDLNLESYDEPLDATNAPGENDLGVMRSQSFVATDNGSQVFSRLVNNQNEVGTGDAGKERLHEQEDGPGKPLLNLLGNLLVPLVQSGNLVEQDGGQLQSRDRVKQENGGLQSYNTQYLMSDQFPEGGGISEEIQGRFDSSTDEEGMLTATNLEVAMKFPHSAANTVRQDSSLPRPIVPPSMAAMEQGFHTRVTAPFLSPEPRFQNEAFRHDRMRRPSYEGDQHLRSPGFRLTQDRANQWDHGPPFGPRGIRQPIRESRDPRLRRREMMARHDVRPPFVDHDVDLHGVGNFEREREDMLGRRFPVGEERDITHSEISMDRRLPLPFDRPPMEARERFPIMDRDMPHHLRDVVYDEHHDRAMHELRGTHPLERHMGRPDEGRGALPPFQHRRPSLDRPDLHHSEFEPRQAIDQAHTFDHTPESRDPRDGRYPTPSASHEGEEQGERGQQTQGDLPTSQGNTSDGVTPAANAPPFGERGAGPYPQGGGQYPPEQPTSELEKFEAEGYDDDINYDHVAGQAYDQDVISQDMRHVDGHFEMRGELHGGERRPRFPPPDHMRPIRSSYFGPRYQRPEGFSGPRNFHGNLGPREFRPRNDMGRGRPRFHPAGARLKRPGAPFNGDHIKRPHY